MFSAMLLSLVLAGDLPDHFKPLAPLLANDWVTDFPREMTDTQRFEVMYDGRHIRNIHWVRDKTGRVVYQGETIYTWDHRAKRIVWYYFNATGGHIVGHIEREGDALVAYGINNAPGTQTPETKSRMVIRDETWQMTQFFQREGEWREQHSVTYRPVE
jgi:hypothetical protein